MDSAARLVDRLLGACPGVRVLATSREPLGITGEALCPVPPLPLPPPGTLDALGYPAVRLFADRAAAVRPDFDPVHEPAEIQRICAALDGLPLAIELAAARLRSLTVAEVAARLDDRFRLLSRGDRTKAPRHRTLRAVVEWSWDLLREDERRLARRLTVFAGGATLEAAAEVCGLPAEEADELLADLVDKSLIEDSAGRYRMLESIRAFCAERLAEAGERDATHAAHAAYFMRLGETADPYMRQAEQLDWLARLGAEHGNLMAALRWAVPADQLLALRLLAAMASYWWLRGLRTEGAPEALDLLGPDRARAARRAGGGVRPGRHDGRARRGAGTAGPRPPADHRVGHVRPEPGPSAGTPDGHRAVGPQLGPGDPERRAAAAPDGAGSVVAGTAPPRVGLRPDVLR